MSPSQLLTRVRRARSLPPRVVAQRIMAAARGKSLDLYRRARDAALPTYPAASTGPQGSLYQYVHTLPTDVLRTHASVIAAVASNYLEHRFDLLGSGWVRVEHGMRCRGLEGFRYEMGSAVTPDQSGRWLTGRVNRANLVDARRIWRLVDPGYRPIDWHLDFKSGFRWSESTWYRDIPYGHLPGVDVKVPWELARMQHLPTLAWAYALALLGEHGFQPAETYAREFRNQVLDFVATNPPWYGVNWRTTMDVAIRASNWLLAFDLFRAAGARFDNAFELVFRQSIYAHGRHIVANLEWYPLLRGNHYLSDIAGLLFIAAYLPRTPTTDAWLAFATQELVGEVCYQFTADGASFEASTSYHRLTAQMVAFCTALILGFPPEKRAALRAYDARRHRGPPALRPASLPHYALKGMEWEVPFPPDYLLRLARMGHFTRHVTKPDGRIHQVGDNDSGQFFRLHPRFLPMSAAEARSAFSNLDGYSEIPDQDTYWHHDDLDHRSVACMFAGLLERSDSAAMPEEDVVDEHVIRQLAGGIVLPHSQLNAEGDSAHAVRIGDERAWSALRAHAETVSTQSRTELHVRLASPEASQELVARAYPEFGLYVFRSARVYLAVRCGPIGQAGNGGHAHNDQLAVELQVDGEDWLLDPGTYIYTPLPGRRNEYRSVRAHFAPRVDAAEPGRLSLGLFALGDEAKAECLYFGPRGFAGRHGGYGAFVYRMVELQESGLRILDFAEGGLRLADPLRFDPPPFSPGYGVRWRRSVSPRIEP